MTDAPEEWPAYQVGPKDSIFAIGLVGVNYAQLEFAVFALFSAILGLERDVSLRLMFKMGPEMRDKLMRESLPDRDWPDNVKGLVQHFIEAHKICYENRNKLMHSNLIAVSPGAILFTKTGRDGKGTMANPSLRELRQVADDMRAYFDYGLQLGHMINTEFLGMKGIVAGDPWYRSWPEKQPLPIPLEYTSDPRPIRPLR